ncbi:hypothetical protein D3C86_1516460 [compost metagenome]
MFSACINEVVPNKKVDQSGCPNNGCTFIKLCNGSGINQIVTRFKNDNYTRNGDQRPLNKSGKKLNFSMSVRMIFILRQGSQVNAVKCEAAGQYIHNTFGRIRKYGIGMRNKVGDKFRQHQHNADAQCD